MLLTFCVAVFSSSEEPVPVLGVFDVQLYQVFLLQVQQVLHRLVAIQQQGRGVLLQQQQQLISINTHGALENKKTQR